MYGMVVMLALSQSPAVGPELTARPDQERYGNHLQDAHYRHNRRGCGSSCSSGCSTGCGYGGCGYGSCSTGCGVGGCGVGSCYSGSCGVGGCAMGDCGPSGYYATMPAGRGLRGRNNYVAMPYGSPYMASTMEPATSSQGSPSQRSFFAGPSGQEAPALLIVHVPADATLTVDGHQTQSRDSTRILESPPLQPGREFTYELKATAPRNGKTETKQVKVRAGERTEITMKLDGQDGAQRLPAESNR